MKPNILPVAFDLPIAPLVAKLEANPQWWDEITDRQDHPGSAHHDTKAIFLRWCPERDAASVFTDLRVVNYPRGLDLLNEAVPIVEQIRKMLATMRDDHAELARVMIVSLKAGGKIDQHVDEGSYADTFERFHVALTDTSNALEVWRADGVREYITMLPGEAWWFNHKQPHACANYGETDRWHLIVDMKAPQYRRERGD